jgi:RNA polymerase sigma-70 factor (ECF subfamily)
MEEASLSQAITRARDGDPEAFRELLDAYGHRLYGYFFRATGRHHDAEDLLSELSLRLVRRLGKYDERGRFEPWLFRIAANLVRDRIRKAKARPGAVSLSMRPDGEDRTADEVLPDPRGDDVDHALLRHEENLRLEQALEKLDDASRQMILMRHFGGMSFREIAEEMGCPLGTALAKVHRALKALRRSLEMQT